MEEYFTKATAENKAGTFSHLEGTEFIVPKSRIKYTIFCVMAVPADRDEQDELRELLKAFIEGGMVYGHDMALFDARKRDDKHTICLFAVAVLKTGVNLLSVLTHQFVDQEGQIRYGFQVHPQLVLF